MDCPRVDALMQERKGLVLDLHAYNRRVKGHTKHASAG